MKTGNSDAKAPVSAVADAPGVRQKKSMIRYPAAVIRLDARNPFFVPKDSSMSDNAARTRYIIVYRNPLYRQKVVQRSADDAMFFIKEVVDRACDEEDREEDEGKGEADSLCSRESCRVYEPEDHQGKGRTG